LKRSEVHKTAFYNKREKSKYKNHNPPIVYSLFCKERYFNVSGSAPGEYELPDTVQPIVTKENESMCDSYITLT